MSTVPAIIKGSAHADGHASLGCPVAQGWKRSACDQYSSLNTRCGGVAQVEKGWCAQGTDLASAADDAGNGVSRSSLQVSSFLVGSLPGLIHCLHAGSAQCQSAALLLAAQLASLLQIQAHCVESSRLFHACFTYSWAQSMPCSRRGSVGLCLREDL